MLTYDIIILCENGSKFLQFDELIQQDPDIEIGECENGDQLNEKLPKGQNAVQGPRIGEHYFEPEQVAFHRKQIFEKCEVCGQKYIHSSKYYGITESNKEN